MTQWNGHGPIARFTGLCFAVALAAVAPAQAATVTYDFEGFGDSTPLTSQIAGLTFTNATVLTSGLSLNDVEFPPRSGSNVVFDEGGAVTINFMSPVFGVGAYFTYVSRLTFSAYDSSNTLLGSVLSNYAINTAINGDPGSSSNEFLSVANAGGLIARLVITGNPTGGSFVFDDLMVDLGRNAVPEPATLALVSTLLATGCLRGGWLRRRTRHL